MHTEGKCRLLAGLGTGFPTGTLVPLYPDGYRVSYKSGFLLGVPPPGDNHRVAAGCLLHDKFWKNRVVMDNARVLVAFLRGDAQAVAAGLDEGGGVDARSAEQNDATLLMGAAAVGNEAMVRMLLQRGASVNLQNSAGATAVTYAALQGHTTTVQALLDAKADSSLQTIDGSTALMAAERFKHTTIAQLLRLHAKSQAPGRLYDLHPVSGTLSGRRVRIGGLKARPELNGRCGAAGRFDAAKGRYEVAVEGEAETVLLKPANLQDGWLQKLLEPAVPALTVTLTLSLP